MATDVERELAELVTAAAVAPRPRCPNCGEVIRQGNFSYDSLPPQYDWSCACGWSTRCTTESLGREGVTFL